MNFDPPIEIPGSSEFGMMEDEILRLKNQVAALTLGTERMSLALHAICNDYCKWYDEGLAGLDGAGVAYHLVGHARMALPENQEGASDDRGR